MMQQLSLLADSLKMMMRASESSQDHVGHNNEPKIVRTLGLVHSIF